MSDDQHFKCIKKGNDHIRKNLSHHQFPRTDGRDDQLFNGAALPFAHDGGCRQDGSNGIKDHADHTGDHEVRADEIGVIPDLSPDFERRLDPGRHSEEIGLIRPHRGRVRFANQLRRRQRSGTGCSIRAIEDHRDLCIALRYMKRIIRRDDQYAAHFAPFDEIPHIVQRSNIICNRKIICRAKRIEQRARFGRAALIPYAQRNIFDIRGGGIS